MVPWGLTLTLVEQYAEKAKKDFPFATHEYSSPYPSISSATVALQQHSSSNNIRFFFSRLTLCFAHIHIVPSVEWLLLGVDKEADGCVKHVHITVRRCEQFQATLLLEISQKRAEFGEY